jgi:hypothetical protein
MNLRIFALFTLLAVLPSLALAANCSNSTGYNRLNAGQLQTLLNGNTACYPANGPYHNQEYHNGVRIEDYKLGPGHPKDPKSDIGSYLINTVMGVAQVTYNYTAGGSFSYSVYGPLTGTNYDFCRNNVAPPIVIRIKTGEGC